MGAVLSDCGRYRYSLTREIPGQLGEPERSGTCLFMMLNPSTADASVDDPTIRRCIRFTKDWGYKRLAVGNLFAYRATNPMALRELPLEVAAGPDNDQWLASHCEEASTIVCAWGANRIAPYRMPWVEPILAERGGDVVCLGTTANGSPRHPLYVPADFEPVPFTPVPFPAGEAA
ncbi:MAG TPA: DUF1643 domain-containing protein [Solirubrobacterales bacterium]|nr:DUF1643 domain-containing protein [Solirubrobacterales bacterium]